MYIFVIMLRSNYQGLNFSSNLSPNMSGEKSSSQESGPPPPYSSVGQTTNTGEQPFYPQQTTPQYQPPTFAPPPPPFGGYVSPPPPLMAPTTVVITQMLRLGPHPSSIQCPHCSAHIVTGVNFVPGTLAWVLCIVLLLLGLWCGCCLIPFCMPECQDVEHRCPNCRQFLGVYRRW
uniref:LITAF domain-containing protein n=1 Tax=Romanomermis culicivorax TaxID=13658 RepID=A0A915JLF6_ROMCU